MSRKILPSARFYLTFVKEFSKINEQMDLITTHTGADFDAVASLLGAKKLYPQAKIIWPGSPNQNVSRFLNAYPFLLDLTKPKTIDFKKVTRLIITDTRLPSRLGAAEKILNNPGLTVHLYDHHPRTKYDLSAEKDINVPYGAVTTFFVREIKSRGIKIPPAEATFLCLGIYEDTGCFSYISTTSEDLKAVGWLLQQRAGLSVVSRYLTQALGGEQVELLNRLTQNAKTYFIGDFKIIIAAARVSRYTGELATITHRLREIFNPEAIFVLVQSKNCLHLVSRSRVKEIDVGQLSEEFDGGGHPTAASATIYNQNLSTVRDQLLSVLRGRLHRAVYAKSVMSTPVKVIRSSMLIREAHAVMKRFNHRCLPVLQGNKLIGIITLQASEKALRLGLAEATVDTYMCGDLISVGLDTDLSTVKDLFRQRDVEHLLVFKEHKKLCGLITRNDLSPRTGQQAAGSRQRNNKGGRSSTMRTTKLLKESIPKKIFELLKQIGEIAQEEHYQVYLVGGFVRDLLLKVENLDLDLAVEKQAIAFAKILAERLRGSIKNPTRFGTVVFCLHGYPKIDLATARKEFYEYPAALPEVQFSSIKQDMYRRDFTINAMAIKLNPEGFGQLVDFFGGEKDLQNKTIRALHSFAFAEDPTRILRAVRFEQRYHFKMEPQTLKFLQDTLRLNLLEKLTGERVRDELVHLLSEEKPYFALHRLQELNILPHIYPGWKLSPAAFRKIKLLQEKKSEVHCEQVKFWLVYFLLTLDSLSLRKACSLAQKLRLSNKDQTVVKLSKTPGIGLIKKLSVSQKLSASEVYKYLRNLPEEIYVFMWVSAKNKNFHKRLKEYLLKLRKVKLKINGDTLKSLGYQPGKQFSQILEKVLMAKLDGKLRTKKQEIQFVIDNFPKK